MSTRPSTPPWSMVPRPLRPSTPEACASSTIIMAPWRSAASVSPGSAPISPSMENTPSVINSLRPGTESSSPRIFSAAEASLCRNTWILARERRQPSMMLAWFSSSLTMWSSGPRIAATVPALAAKPDWKTTQASTFLKAAMRSSSCMCILIRVHRRSSAAILFLFSTRQPQRVGLRVAWRGARLHQVQHDAVAVSPDHRLNVFKRSFVGQKRHPFHRENRRSLRYAQQFGRGRFHRRGKVGFSRPRRVQLVAALQNLVERNICRYHKARHECRRDVGRLDTHRLAAGQPDALQDKNRRVERHQERVGHPGIRLHNVLPQDAGCGGQVVTPHLLRKTG